MPPWRTLMTPILLAILIVWIVVWKLHTFNEPLERDITTYSLFATEMLHGKSLYADLWDHKPPAIFVTYAAVQGVFGQRLFSIFLLWLIPSLLVLWGIYQAAVSFNGRRSTGLWAAAFWAFTCASLSLQANQPNTEIFINACMVWAFVLLLHWREDNGFIWRQIGIGLLIALASLYKQVVVAVPVLLAAGLLINASISREERKAKIIRAATAVAIWAGCGILLWQILFGYMALTGRFSIFIDTVFRYSPAYAGSLSQNMLHSFSTEVLFAPHTLVLWPFAVLGITGFAVHLARGRFDSRWMLWLAYAIGSHLAMALPGKYYAHYYQLELPALIIGVAWAVDEIGLCACWHGRIMSATAGILALALPFVFAVQSLQLSPEEWSNRKYGPLFVQSKTMGETIAQYLQPGESFGLFGEESGIYFYSHRRPPTGVLYISQMSEGPLAGYLANKAIQDMDRVKPRFLVALTWRLGDPEAESAYRQWVLKNYRPVAPNSQFGLFTLMSRNDLADAAKPWFS